MNRWALLAALLAATGAHSQTPSPFDPASYLDQKQAATAPVGDDRLVSRSIYRIDGNRFQKFTSTTGSVFLPSTGSKPELLDEFALCDQHLKLLTEVIPLRDKLDLDADVKKDEAAILVLIQKCREGLIKGPRLIVENPDGSLTEVQAKKPKPKARTKEKDD